MTLWALEAGDDAEVGMATLVGVGVRPLVDVEVILNES